MHSFRARIIDILPVIWFICYYTRGALEKQRNEHNVELQQADPGNKVKGNSVLHTSHAMVISIYTTFIGPIKINL